MADRTGFVGNPPRALVIDDNESVRLGLMKVLARAGFQVEGAANGIDALIEVERHPFDAITCDMMMPRLDGMGFFENLEERHPELIERVIFVTAWGDEPEVRDFAAEKGRPILQKPFEMDAFVDAVRLLLD